MTQYYFSNGQEPSGPFTLDELSKQSFTPASLVWHEGMAEWQPAAQVPELKSLLPVTPPPIRRAPTPPPALPSPLVTPAATSTFSVPPVVEPQVSSSASVPKINPVFIAGGVLLVIGLLIAFVTLRNPGYNDYSVPNNQASSNDAATQAAAAQQAALQTAEAQVVEAKAAQTTAEKEQTRAWSREHFMEFVQVYPNEGYTVGTFGGVSTGTFTIVNAAGYRLENVVVAIDYYKPNGSIINTRTVDVTVVPAHGKSVEVFPSNERRVSVACRLLEFAAPGLAYNYNINGNQADPSNADVGNPEQ